MDSGQSRVSTTLAQRGIQITTAYTAISQIHACWRPPADINKNELFCVTLASKRPKARLKWMYLKISKQYFLENVARGTKWDCNGWIWVGTSPVTWNICLLSELLFYVIRSRQLKYLPSAGICWRQHMATQNTRDQIASTRCWGQYATTDQTTQLIYRKAPGTHHDWAN